MPHSCILLLRQPLPPCSRFSIASLHRLSSPHHFCSFSSSSTSGTAFCPPASTNGQHDALSSLPLFFLQNHVFSPTSCTLLRLLHNQSNPIGYTALLCHPTIIFTLMHKRGNRVHMYVYRNLKEIPSPNPASRELFALYAT